MKSLVNRGIFNPSSYLISVVLFLLCPVIACAETIYPDGNYGSWNNCRFIKEGSTLKIILEGSSPASTDTPSWLYVPNYEPSDCVGCNIAGGSRIYVKGGLYDIINDMKINHIILGEGFTSISSNFFENCSTITTFTLPSSLQTIEKRAFKKCSGMQSITLPTNITNIGVEAFAECTDLSMIEIPESISAVGNLAFTGCSNLKDIIIKCNLAAFSTTSGAAYRQFEKCINIKSIRLKSQINSSENEIPALSALFGNAFESIEELEFLPGSNYIRWSQGISGEGDEYIKEMPNLKNLILCEGIEIIGHGAFKGSTLLKNIDLPNSLKIIENRAFKESGLIAVTLPINVNTIDYRVLENCNDLKQLTIGCKDMERIPAYFCVQCTTLKSVVNDIRFKPQTIGAYAFSGCTSLSKITIPSSVTTIEDDAFNGCINVNQLIAEPLVPPTCGSYPHYPFEGITRNNVLYVPKESYSKYENSEVWKTFLNNYSYDWEQTMMQRDALLVEATVNKVEIEWPEDENAERYNVEISEEGKEEINSFTVASYNNTNTNYANDRRQILNSNITGIKFTLIGLREETIYNYTLNVIDNLGEVINSYSGSFETGGSIEGYDLIQSDAAPHKLFRDGQILILRGDRTYTLTGVEVK